MNTTKYEVFARAATLGSLSKAAEEMDYTQSYVSHMMRSLGIGVPRLKDAPPAVNGFIRQVRRMVGPKSTVLLP